MPRLISSPLASKRRAIRHFYKEYSISESPSLSLKELLLQTQTEAREEDLESDSYFTHCLTENNFFTCTENEKIQFKRLIPLHNQSKENQDNLDLYKFMRDCTDIAGTVLHYFESLKKNICCSYENFTENTNLSLTDEIFPGKHCNDFILIYSAESQKYLHQDFCQYLDNLSSFWFTIPSHSDSLGLHMFEDCLDNVTTFDLCSSFCSEPTPSFKRLNATYKPLATFVYSQNKLEFPKPLEIVVEINDLMREWGLMERLKRFVIDMNVIHFSTRQERLVCFPFDFYQGSSFKRLDSLSEFRMKETFPDFDLKCRKTFDKEVAYEVDPCMICFDSVLMDKNDADDSKFKSVVERKSLLNRMIQNQEQQVLSIWTKPTLITSDFHKRVNQKQRSKAQSHLVLKKSLNKNILPEISSDQSLTEAVKILTQESNQSFSRSKKIEEFMKIKGKQQKCPLKIPTSEQKQIRSQGQKPIPIISTLAAHDANNLGEVLKDHFSTQISVRFFSQLYPQLDRVYLHNLNRQIIVWIDTVVILYSIDDLVNEKRGKRLFGMRGNAVNVDLLGIEVNQRNRDVLISSVINMFRLYKKCFVIFESIGSESTEQSVCQYVLVNQAVSKLNLALSVIKSLKSNNLKDCIFQHFYSSDSLSTATLINLISQNRHLQALACPHVIDLEQQINPWRESTLTTVSSIDPNEDRQHQIKNKKFSRPITFFFFGFWPFFFFSFFPQA